MKKVIILTCLALYSGLWWHAKNEPLWSDRYLSPPIPAQLLRIVTGYGQHMAGFSLFVKTSVFMGNTKLDSRDEPKYADSLAQNFDAASQLYPKFIDIYYFTQSFLPHISPEYARVTNKILERGIAAHPDNLLFPFFKGFNHFYYLREPIRAGELFYDLSKHPDAPPWFGHLAATLMARGGNLIAGRAMLQGMYEMEREDDVKERYRRGIENFEQAIKVQKALDAYRQEQGRDAASLRDLVPHHLDALPKLHDGAQLVWEPPVLRLDRQ